MDKIWEKGYVTTDKIEFSMSFICGVSNKRILGLMGVKETITTEIIVIYLKNMLEELRSSNNNCNSQWVIILDNATIHFGPEFRSFIKSSKLRVITIPSYQSVLNPTESS